MIMGDSEIKFGDISINLALNQALWNGKALSLEPKGIQVFAVLATHANQPVKREAIIQQVWPDAVVEEDSLNRAISHIRKAIASNPLVSIETIRGVGYKLTVRETLNSPEEKSISPKRLFDKRRLATYGIIGLLTITLAWLLYPKTTPKNPLLKFKQRVVTSDIGIENSPSISPDGKYLAYIWDGGSGAERKVYIREVNGGTPIKFSEGQFNDKSPAWSNDGTRIAYFEVNQGNVLLKVSPFLRHAPVVVDSVELIPVGSGLAWSKDDRSLVYSAIRNGEPNFKLYQLDLQTLEKTMILGSVDRPTVHYSQPKVSPAGDKMITLKREKQNVKSLPEIKKTFPVVLEVVNTQNRSILFSKTYDLPVHSMDWIDDETLVYIAENDQSFSIEQLNLTTGETLELHNTGRLIHEISYSRSEEAIYLEQWFGNVNLNKLKFSQGQLTTRSVFLSSSRFEWNPVYSPEAGAIAFFSDRSGLTQVWLHQVEENKTKQVTAFQDDESLANMAFSPSGKLLVVNHLIGRRLGEILILDLEGQEKNRIGKPGHSLFNPQWSVDGRFIYYAMDDSTGNRSNWKYNLDRGEAEKLNMPPSSDLREIDGRLYTTRTGQRGLWVAPLHDLTKVSLVTDRLYDRRSRYWDIMNDRLFMINLYGYDNVLEIVDLKTGHLLDSLPVDAFIPASEPGAIFLPDSTIIFPVVDGMEAEIISLTRR